MCALPERLSVRAPWLGRGSDQCKVEPPDLRLYCVQYVRRATPNSVRFGVSFFARAVSALSSPTSAADPNGYLLDSPDACTGTPVPRVAAPARASPRDADVALQRPRVFTRHADRAVPTLLQYGNDEQSIPCARRRARLRACGRVDRPCGAGRNAPACAGHAARRPSVSIKSHHPPRAPIPNSSQCTSLPAHAGQHAPCQNPAPHDASAAPLAPRGHWLCLACTWLLLLAAPAAAPPCG